MQQQPARAAIGIENKHLLVALGVTNGLLNGCGNAVGPEMQVRRQALQIQMIPAARAFHGQHLMCQRPAGNQQDAPGTGGRQPGLGKGQIVHR